MYFNLLAISVTFSVIDYSLITDEIMSSYYVSQVRYSGSSRLVGPWDLQ